MCGVHCLKQDLQDLSDLQEWTSLLTETPVIELPNYLFKLHKVCATTDTLPFFQDLWSNRGSANRNVSKNPNKTRTPHPIKTGSKANFSISIPIKGETNKGIA